MRQLSLHRLFQRQRDRAAWILLHGDAVDMGCAPSGNDRLNFHPGHRLKLNLVTNLLACDRARDIDADRPADLLISATVRRLPTRNDHEFYISISTSCLPDVHVVAVCL